MANNDETSEFSWDKMWEEGNTGWHMDRVQDVLKNHYDYLTAGVGQCSILVPLCGKSLDMKWLAEQGHSVVGIDIVELAAQQFFTENDLPFNKYTVDDFSVYESTNDKLKIKFLVGDLFNCTCSNTGYFDAIWDCNSIVAIDPQLREKFADTVCSLLKPLGRILLSTFEYDTSIRYDYPHSILPATFETLFSTCSVVLAETIDITKWFKPIFQLPWAKRHILYITKTK